MAEEVVETKDEVTSAPVESVDTEVKEEVEEKKNPFFDYLQSVFDKKHVDEYIEKLNEKQKEFLFVFISGFETALNRHIIGVYEKSYIEGHHFTEDILKSVNLILRPIEVTDLELNFVIAVQL